MGRKKKQPLPDPTKPTRPQYRVITREKVPRYILETADYADENYTLFRFRGLYDSLMQADRAGRYFTVENPLEITHEEAKRLIRQDWADRDRREAIAKAEGGVT